MINPAPVAENSVALKNNILVVDDRPDGLLALEAVLSGDSYNLVKAASGREALHHALYQDFAVILLDVQMPELDGFETARLLRANYRSQHTPIIFVTAIDKEISHINEGYESGAVDYIFKPLDPFVLKSKVDVFADLFNKNAQIKRQAELLKKIELQEKERQMSELRQEALRRYVNLADAVPHIILKVQTDGTIEYFNHRWYAYTGFHPESGTDWRSAIHPRDRRKFLAFWLRTRGRNIHTSQTDIRLRDAGGMYRWHLVRMVPESRNDETIGWIVTCTDVDDIKKAEEMFRSLSLDLDRSNKELEQFAFAASHDLQEPLRIVSSYIDLLVLRQKEALDPKSREIVRITKDGVTRAQKLVRDLLEYARVGIKEKKFQEACFESIARQAIFNVSLLSAEKGGRITYDPLPTLKVDDVQMTQVFQNLITNALKYCCNVPRVHINARKMPHEWVFSVADNGIGIDPKYYDRIFVIFQRLHLSDQYQGTGIGLAICKKIIERHGGRIWVESRPNQGTTFYFSIPQ